MSVFSFGADWLTLTNVLQDNQKLQSLMTVFLDRSEVNTKWKAGGYKGLQDIGKDLKYGSRIRKDGRADEILVASGKRSEKIALGLGNIGGYNVTRLDLQITMQPEKPNPGMARDMYEKILLQDKMGMSPTGRRKVSLIRSPSGDTLYIGTRKTGRKFYRLYDKGFDEGFGLGLLWRAEVQYGRDMASAALKVYKEIGTTGTCVMDLVCSEFYDAAKIELFEGCKMNAEIITENYERKVTVQRKLDWLATCVRPTIAFLLEEDLEDEMLDALGLKGGRQRKWTEVYNSIDLDNGCEDQ